MKPTWIMTMCMAKMVNDNDNAGDEQSCTSGKASCISPASGMALCMMAQRRPSENLAGDPVFIAERPRVSRNLLLEPAAETGYAYMLQKPAIVTCYQARHGNLQLDLIPKPAVRPATGTCRGDPLPDMPPGNCYKTLLPEPATGICYRNLPPEPATGTCYCKLLPESVTRTCYKHLLLEPATGTCYRNLVPKSATGTCD